MAVKVVAAGKKYISAKKQENVNSYVPDAHKNINSFISDDWQQIPVFHWEELMEGAVITVYLKENRSVVEGTGGIKAKAVLVPSGD